MKARRVTITLEISTGLPISVLRVKDWWLEGMRDGSEDPDLEVLQVEVNVIKRDK